MHPANAPDPLQRVAGSTNDSQQVSSAAFALNAHGLQPLLNSILRKITLEGDGPGSSVSAQQGDSEAHLTRLAAQLGPHSDDPELCAHAAVLTRALQHTRDGVLSTNIEHAASEAPGGHVPPLVDRVRAAGTLARGTYLPGDPIQLVLFVNLDLGFGVYDVPAGLQRIRSALERTLPTDSYCLNVACPECRGGLWAEVLVAPGRPMGQEQQHGAVAGPGAEPAGHFRIQLLLAENRSQEVSPAGADQHALSAARAAGVEGGEGSGLTVRCVGAPPQPCDLESSLRHLKLLPSGAVAGTEGSVTSSSAGGGDSVGGEDTRIAKQQLHSLLPTIGRLARRGRNWRSLMAGLEEAEAAFWSRQVCGAKDAARLLRVWWCQQGSVAVGIGAAAPPPPPPQKDGEDAAAPSPGEEAQATSSSSAEERDLLLLLDLIALHSWQQQQQHATEAGTASAADAALLPTLERAWRTLAGLSPQAAAPAAAGSPGEGPAAPGSAHGAAPCVVIAFSGPFGADDDLEALLSPPRRKGRGSNGAGGKGGAKLGGPSAGAGSGSDSGGEGPPVHAAAHAGDGGSNVAAHAAGGNGPQQRLVVVRDPANPVHDVAASINTAAAALLACLSGEALGALASAQGVPSAGVLRQLFGVGA